MALANPADRVFVFVFALLLAGCQQGEPALVKGCAVQAEHSGEVAFDADLLNRQSKTASAVRVLVETTGLISGPPGHDTGGSIIQYTLFGQFVPGRWVHGRTLKPSKADPFTFDQHLGSIRSCYVHEVDYQDGSHWLGPSPL